MKGDFSRDTFDPKKHYNAVLMQQGRVQLDADWNEQRAIDRYRIEAEARDLIGSSETGGLFGVGGGQVSNAGFEIGVLDRETLSIGPGNLYVDGILCQNEESEDGKPLLFEEQPDLPGEKAIELLQGDIEVGLVCLDVWERHVTGLEDEVIREVALGGPDTATRGRTVWQAKVLPIEANIDVVALQPLLEEHAEIASRLKRSSGETAAGLRADLARTNRRILRELEVSCDGPFVLKDFGSKGEAPAVRPPSTGRLLARTSPPASAEESPCLIAPGAGYERLENQLYRVEIHNGGPRGIATFKWSRDNASVMTAVLGITSRGTGAEIAVRDLGRDETLGFANGQVVELLDDGAELSGQPGRLMPIQADPATRTITVDQPLDNVDPGSARAFHYKLRRWDSPGAVRIPAEQGAFVELEGGIQVQFTGGQYNTGDYWLIPARTATGAIEWPENQARPPAGVHHHYARLALVMAATVAGEGQPPVETGSAPKSAAGGTTSPPINPGPRVRQLLVLADCRRMYPPVTELTSLFYLSGDGQEAGSGQPLLRPLVVGVANGDKPVVGAHVKFEVQKGPDESYDGYLVAASETARNVAASETARNVAATSMIATTDARGEARCFWTLATGRPSQQVKASLVDGTHLGVYFNANLSAAGEAVAEGIQVTRLLVGPPPQAGQVSQEQDLRLDAVVPVNALAGGIRVVCNPKGSIDPQTVVGKPTCFVTLNMPFPHSASDRTILGDPPVPPSGFVGFQPLILAAQVSVSSDGKRIVWTPTTETSNWLQTRLFQVAPAVPAELTARLTLKGNFIWDIPQQGKPLAYLDGDVFGGLRSSGPGTELQLPSGDGRRGGDLEMWFRLVAQTLLLDSVTLDRSEVVGGTQVTTTGTVRLIGGTAPLAGTPILLQSSDAAVLLSAVGATTPGTQSFTVTVPAGQSSVNFRVTTQAVPNTKPVTITATLPPPPPPAGVTTTTRSVNLVVKAPTLTSVTLSPPGTVVGRAGTVQGTVTLDGPAPPNFTVNLVSDQPAFAKLRQGTTTATGQLTVTVPANSTTANFQVDTEPVSSPLAFTIRATAQGVERTATMTIQPPTVSGLTLASPVRGGTSSSGTLTINGPAPANFTFTLDSLDTSRATLPTPSVQVPLDSTSAPFSVSTKPVATDGPVTIRALRSGVVQRTVSLTVDAPDTSSFTFVTSPIDGGASTTGRITLLGSTPSGTSIRLTPSNDTVATFSPAATVAAPATVTVPPNVTLFTFTATGRSFTGSSNQSVTVTASYRGGDGGTLSATLTVRPTKSKEKEKDGKEKEKELAIAKEREDKVVKEKEDEFLISGSSGVEEPGTAEGEPAGTNEESGEPGGAEEGPAPGRPFVQPAERPAAGQQALDQSPDEEEG